MDSTKPALSTGSLLNTSEGLLVSTLTALVGTIAAGDHSDILKMVAVSGLAIAVAAYSVARALAKKGS